MQKGLATINSCNMINEHPLAKNSVNVARDTFWRSIWADVRKFGVLNFGYVWEGAQKLGVTAKGPRPMVL